MQSLKIMRQLIVASELELEIVRNWIIGSQIERFISNVVCDDGRVKSVPIDSEFLVCRAVYRLQECKVYWWPIF